MILSFSKFQFPSTKLIKPTSKSIKLDSLELVALASYRKTPKLVRLPDVN